YRHHPAPTETYTLSLHDALPIYLTKLKQVPDALRQRINETWGDGEPSPIAEQVHAGVVALVQELVHLSLLPGQVTKTRLTDEYLDRKSTRLNSSHVKISYAVFCL